MPPSELYLVVFEQERYGYILRYFEKQQDAQDFSEKAFDALHAGSLWEYVKQYGDKYFIACYKINGSCCYLGKFSCGVGDGVNSFNVIKIDPISFKLAEFIKERENSSYLFDFLETEFENEKLNELLDRYPDFMYLAN